MARRSPPVVNQKYDTGCTWPMFRIFNFRQCHSNRRLVSSRKHLNTHATGNENLRSSSDVIGTVVEKSPQIGVSSRRRRRYCSCKSISCVENDQVADQGNEETKMIVDQRFVNKNYQANQLLDALQILYSNKELFLKLLKDPNSLLVKLIHDLPRSQEKEPYQVRQKRITRLNKFGSVRQSGKQFKSFDRYDSSSGCKPRSSNKIVVFKPGTINVKIFADTSHSSFSYNVQNMKPSHFTFGCINIKFRYFMKVRRKKQHWRITNRVPYKFTCGYQGIEDGKKVKELEIAGRNLLTYGSIEKRLDSSLDLKKRHKIFKVKDSELCTEQEEAASLGLQNEEENGSFSSFRQKINDLPGAIVKTPSENLQLFGSESSDISIRKSFHGDNLHAHNDIPRDGEFKDTPTQNFDINNASKGIGSFLDSHPEIQILSFSPEVASSSPSPSQRIEDNINMRNRVEHTNTESVVEHFTGEDVTNSGITKFKPDFYVREILQVFSLKCDELFMKCESYDQMLDPLSTFDELNGLLTSQLSSNKILVDCVIETFMEVYKIHSFPPRFSTKSPDFQAYVVKKVMVKEITELINLHFLPHPLSPITLEQLVEKDFAKRGSWLNIQVDIQDIVIEVEEDVLEKLVLEIVFEIMDIRSIIGSNEPCLP